MIHKTPFFSIYYGDATDRIFSAHYRGLTVTGKTILEDVVFAPLEETLGISQAFFLNQTHSDRGVIITSSFDPRPFCMEGDFLITAQKGIGIGIMTADCLPLILYDPICMVIAAVHAGWRGTMANIARKAVESMSNTFGSRPADMQAFFGPAARACCYEVTAEFKDYFKEFADDKQVFQQRDGKLFFEVSRVNILQLQKMGIPLDALHTYPEFPFGSMEREARMETSPLTPKGVLSRRTGGCTICNDSYYSYRRQGEKAGRQMTVVCLR